MPNHYQRVASVAPPMSKKKNIAGVARTAYLVCVLSLCFV
jgi:hypothetical protein